MSLIATSIARSIVSDITTLVNEGLPSAGANEQRLFHSNTPRLDGKIYGEQWGRGTQRDEQPGRCVNLSSSAYIACGNNAAFKWGSGDGWVSCWINTATTPSGADDWILSCGTAGTNGRRWGLKVNQTTAYPVFQIDDNTVLKESVGTASIADSAWHHLVGVRSGNSLLLYVDGTLAATTDITGYGDINDASYGLLVGAYQDTSPAIGNFYTGKVFDLRVGVAGEIVTATEVSQLYTQAENALPNKATALHLKLDDTHPTIAWDSGPGKRHGTKTTWNVSANHHSGSDVPWSWQNKKGFSEYTNFDGTNDYVLTQTTVNLASSIITFSADVRGQTASTAIVAQGGSSDGYMVYLNASGQVEVILKQSGGSNHYAVRGSTDIRNLYKTVAVTIDYTASDPVVTISLDGVAETLVTVTAKTGSYSESATTVVVGARASGASLFFKGIIYDLSITNGTNTYTATGRTADANGWGPTATVNGPVTVRIPRDESAKTLDVFGQSLQYTGKCPGNGLFDQNNCMHFNGSTEHVSVPDHADFDITDNLTVFIRAKNDDATTGTEVYLSKYDINSKREWAILSGGAGQMQVLIGNTSGTAFATWQATATYSFNTTHSVAFTFASGTLKVYRNGVQIDGSITSGSLPTSLVNQSSPVSIGSFFSSGSPVNFYDGTLYDARIYKGDSAPLTPSQILAIHNRDANSVTFDGQTLVGWWKGAEGSGTTIHDASGNGHHGTATSINESTFWGTKQNVFNPNGSEGWSYGINLDSTSNNFSSGFSFNNSVLDSQVEPDWQGLPRAAKIIENATPSVQHWCSKNLANVTANSTYTISFKAKSAGRDIFSLWTSASSPRVTSSYNLGTGSLGSSSTVGGGVLLDRGMIDLGDGWYWCYLTFSQNLTIAYMALFLNNGAVYNGDGASGILICDRTLTPGFFEPYYAETAGTATNSYRIPALADGSADARGYPLTHPATTGHNNCESSIDLTGGVAAPRKRWDRPVNLLTFSESFDNAAWAKTRATVTPNAVEAIDGTMSMDKLVENGDTNTHYISQSVTLTANTYTVSVYAKAAERSWLSFLNNTISNVSAYFDLSTGTVGTVGSAATAAIEALGGGVYRCSMTFTGTAVSHQLFFRLASADLTPSYAGDSSSGLYLWGAQLEKSATPGEYTPSDWSDTPPRFSMPNNVIPALSTWSVSYVTDSGSVADPDGGTSAKRFTEDTTTNYHRIANLQSPAQTIGVWYKWTAKAKLSGRNYFTMNAATAFNARATFNLSNGTVAENPNGHAWLESIGSGWYLCTVLGQATSSTPANIWLGLNNDGTDNAAYLGDGASYMDVYDVKVVPWTNPNPNYSRITTKSGVPWKADRITRYDRVLIGSRNEAAETYTQDVAL